MSGHSVCPSCGAEDSLHQAVRVEGQATRPVYLAGPLGSQKVSYGLAEVVHFAEEEEIRCSRCNKTWDDEEELLDIGPPIEHRCESCDWWGYNPWQHGLERPDCPGEVRRREEIEAVSA